MNPNGEAVLMWCLVIEDIIKVLLRSARDPFFVREVISGAQFYFHKFYKTHSIEQRSKTQVQIKGSEATIEGVSETEVDILSFIFVICKIQECFKRLSQDVFPAYECARLRMKNTKWWSWREDIFGPTDWITSQDQEILLTEIHLREQNFIESTVFQFEYYNIQAKALDFFKNLNSALKLSPQDFDKLRCLTMIQTTIPYLTSQILEFHPDEITFYCVIEAVKGLCHHSMVDQLSLIFQANVEFLEYQRTRKHFQSYCQNSPNHEITAAEEDMSSVESDFLETDYRAELAELPIQCDWPPMEAEDSEYPSDSPTHIYFQDFMTLRAVFDEISLILYNIRENENRVG